MHVYVASGSRDRIPYFLVFIAELEAEHLAKISAKDREMASLTDRLQGLGEQMQRQRDAELKRAGQLESALSAFVTSTKSGGL